MRTTLCLASNLAASDTNEVNDLFLWQRGSSGVQLLSRTADGRAANEESDAPTISDDNRYILFSSSATDLAVPNFDSNSVTFLYDRETAQLSQINPPRVAGRQRGGFFGARLSPDGLAEYIAGTDPKHADSYLRITQIQAGPGLSVTLTWPSAGNRIYTVERASSEPVGFTRLLDFFGDTFETSYRDTWLTNPPPSFYRIRAELP